ncbi:MAG: hypothetical protein Q7W45_14605 [Bacteroidota bacterium]|nr:hypothetical protein [Bacteroidota bacterium]MDO9184478.1 hypothetical protein [Bacteroidia bacterium]MDP3147402.1 hypothetical protein [Bacteroidota bacterium]
MKTYTKTHSNKKAAETHFEKIKKRGGKATMKTVKGGFYIEYSFPEKKVSKNKKYDVISPDGFSIRIGVPLFNSIKERDQYFKMWKKRYEKQGYYSSVKYGRIHLADLADYCEWIEVV